MDEKVAVRCKSLDDVKRVIKKHPCFKSIADSVWNSQLKSEGAICISSNSNGWENEYYYKRDGTKIISASEYLGGESVEREFKVGDEVEVISSGRKFVVEEIRSYDSDGETYLRERKGDNTNGIRIDKMKLVNSKPLKEEVTMADTTIKDVILNHYEKGADAKVVQRYFGSQIADDINGEYLLIDHGPDILERAKDAEKDEQDNS